MPRRITIEPRLTVEELGQRYRAATDPVERSHYQIIWLLAQGRPSEEVATITGYSRSWIYELVWGYNRVGIESLGDKRHELPGAEPLLSESDFADFKAAVQPRWTGVKASEWMSERLGIEVSRQRGWEYLKKARSGATFAAKPKPKKESDGHRPRRGRAIAVALLLLAIAPSLLTGCTSVNSGNVGVASSFGKIGGEPLQPGLHFAFPVIRNVTEISTRSTALPEEFTSLTKDSQKIKIAGTITYSVIPAKAPEALIRVGNEEALKNTIIIPAVLASVKDVIAKYSMDYLIENQSGVSSEISKAITDRLNNNGLLQVSTFDVTGIVLDDNVQESVEKKQIALQDLQRKQTELRAAELEAQRLTILNGALTDKVLLDKAIEKWNGNSVVPPGGSVGASVLVQPNK
jgi:regulator of protease activity HflC (stomatin/prohibitin superfamily)/transposase